MNDLVRIAVKVLLEDHAPSESKAAISQWSSAASFAIGSVVAAIATVVCLMAALWNFARSYTDASGAWLVVAGAGVILWLVLFLVTRRYPVMHHAVGAETPRTHLKDVRDIFDNNKGAVLLAALVAGLVAGAANDRPPGRD